MHFNLPILPKFSSYRDLLSFNSKIRACVRNGFYEEALHLHSTLICSSSVKPHRVTFPSIVKACASLLDLNHGRKTHATIIQMGLQTDPHIASALIKMYARCGALDDASYVFDKTLERDLTVWNAVIDGLLSGGCKEEGISLFRQMQLQLPGIWPDGYSLSIMLGTCSDYLGLLHGEQIHANVIRRMLIDDPFLQTSLIDMYAKCKRPFKAWSVFDGLKNKTISSWNALIGGFCLGGLWEKSLELFVLMKNNCLELEFITFSIILTACSQGQAVAFGKQVHGDLIKVGLESHHFVCTSILTMYAKCGLVNEAYKIFDGVHLKEIELWNAMISAFFGSGNGDDAIHLYNQIRLSGLRSDSFTISNVLSTCSVTGSFDLGRTIHGELIKRTIQHNMAVQSALLTMYAKCGNIEAARLVFNSIDERDVIAWGSMIAGLCENGKFEDAVNFFKGLQVEEVKPDSTVMVTIINACKETENVELGFQVHGLVIKKVYGLDVYVSCALIDMYAKCRLPVLAGSVFSSMTCKNIVAWNSIISCYTWNSCPELAIDLFVEISKHGLVPDSISVTSVLVAVSSLAALLKGKTIHAFHLRHGIQSDLHVNNALLDMYVKCGCLKLAHNWFNIMPHVNIVTWNSLISGYGSHGHCLEAIELFSKMQKSGVLPDDATFLALISSCSHSGLVEVGHKYFQSMCQDYGITPRVDHYAAVVDLYGRAGRLDEAYSFIQNMPTEPDESIWLSLLSSCRAYRKIKLGEFAAYQLLKADPERSGNYVQLLNLYGDAGYWEKAAGLRLLMKERGLKKNPGCSWIEVKDRVHAFSSGGASSPRTMEIHAIMRSLKGNMEDICHKMMYLKSSNTGKGEITLDVVG